eukprot:COSAG01_NODE_46704_length_397_cov_2.788591_1_plen_55_part_10
MAPLIRHKPRQILRMGRNMPTTTTITPRLATKKTKRKLHLLPPRHRTTNCGGDDG